MTFIRPFPGSTGMTAPEVCARCGEVSWLNRWVSSPVGAASVREMPVESRSCGELSLHSRPAWVESPQGVPRPRGRPRAQSTARLRQELEGHWARGRGGTAPRTPRGTGQVCPVHHRKASPMLPRCPAEKFPLPCLASSPKGPPRTSSTLQSGAGTPLRCHPALAAPRQRGTGQKLLPASSSPQTLCDALPALRGHLTDTRVSSKAEPTTGLWWCSSRCSRWEFSALQVPRVHRKRGQGVRPCPC